MEVKYPEVKIKLVGEDGNAFSILGRCKIAVRRAGLDQNVWDEYKEEATSGDYNKLLCTTMDWFDCDSEDDEEYYWNSEEDEYYN